MALEAQDYTGRYLAAAAAVGRGVEAYVSHQRKITTTNNKIFVHTLPQVVGLAPPRFVLSNE